MGAYSGRRRPEQWTQRSRPCSLQVALGWPGRLWNPRDPSPSAWQSSPRDAVHLGGVAGRLGPGLVSPWPQLMVRTVSPFPNVRPLEM